MLISDVINLVNDFFKTWFVIYELHPTNITKTVMHHLPYFFINGYHLSKVQVYRVRIKE